MTWFKSGVATAVGTVVVLATLVSPAAAITRNNALTQAVKDEVPLYSAVLKFVKGASRLTGSASGAQNEAVVVPFGRAIQTLQAKLLSQSWTVQSKHDVRILYSASSPLIADLATANSITSPTSETAWIDKTANDLLVWVADINVVNHDLGLPTLVTNSSAVASCEADGATIHVALLAFAAQNPGVTPTKTLLLGHGDGGPYLESWAHQSHYTYTLTSSGHLRIAAPPATSSVPYTGPSNCADAGI